MAEERVQRRLAAILAAAESLAAVGEVTLEALGVIAPRLAKIDRFSSRAGEDEAEGELFAEAPEPEPEDEELAEGETEDAEFEAAASEEPGEAEASAPEIADAGEPAPEAAASEVAGAAAEPEGEPVLERRAAPARDPAADEREALEALTSPSSIWYTPAGRAAAEPAQPSSDEEGASEAP